MTQQADLQARSPWSILNDIQRIHITPIDRPIEAEVVVPGSKSYSNRALIMAAVADGKSRLKGLLKSDDSYWCMQTLRELGIQVNIDQEEVVEIVGRGGFFPSQQGELYIGAAGTTARFLPGVLAASTSGGEWTVTASKRMSERPMEPLLASLRQLGAEITSLQREGYLPIHIKGNGLKGGEIAISGRVSSQFISGLIIAACYAADPVIIRVTDPIVQHAYVKMTIQLLQTMGAEISYDDGLTEIRITPQVLQGQELALEADASTANYFFALAALTNGIMRVTNLNRQTLQPDLLFLQVLERMGCTVLQENDYIEVQGCAQLKGGFDISMKEMSDQTLTLAALAPFADGPIAIHDVAHIRAHECDRISAIVQLLRQMEIQVEEREDGLTVYPGQPQPALLSSYDDHRVAMSCALIGTKVPGIRIENPGCVSKTCPTYFDELTQLGVKIERIRTYVEKGRS